MKLPKVAIILAAGRGKRLRPITDKIPKALALINSIPVSERILVEIIDSGIKTIIFVVGYLSELIQEHYGSGEKWGVKIIYVTQKIFDGTGSALKVASQYMSESYAVLFCDSYYESGAVTNFLKNKYDNCIAITEVTDPERYGIIEANQNGKIISLTEKPEFPKSNLAIAGMYKLTGKSIKYIQDIKLSIRNEYELPTAINSMLIDGQVFHIHNVGLMKDIGTIKEFKLLNKKLSGKVF